jgi:membrane protein involved in colicin uptake
LTVLAIFSLTAAAQAETKEEKQQRKAAEKAARQAAKEARRAANAAHDDFFPMADITKGCVSLTHVTFNRHTDPKNFYYSGGHMYSVSGTAQNNCPNTVELAVWAKFYNEGGIEVRASDGVRIMLRPAGSTPFRLVPYRCDEYPISDVCESIAKTSVWLDAGAISNGGAQ